MIRHSLLVVALLLAAPSFAEPIKTWPFKVFLDTTEIGQHHFELMQRDAEQEIHSRARFDLKLLFFTAYRYRHENVERWSGNCLITMNSSTDDNGKQFNVQAQQNDKLRVNVNGVKETYPSNCVMSFAYWNPAFLRATQLLHPQTGKLVDVRITPAGTENLKIGNQTVPTQRYILRGPEMRIDLWYSKAGEWLALDAPTESGRTLRYRLEKLPGCAKGPKQQGDCT
jgi:hypothetical protein